MLSIKSLISKVLILDGASINANVLREFFEEHHLIGIKPTAAPCLTDILSQNIDLGCIIISDDYCETVEATLAMVQTIHKLRIELPIGLCISDDNINSLQREAIPSCCTVFSMNDMTPLQLMVSKKILNRIYPNQFISSILELTINAIQHSFTDYCIAHESPSLVIDKLLFGDLLTLIPIESNWCRGMLMLQTDYLLSPSREQFQDSLVNIDEARHFKNKMGELSNYIWGAFKREFIASNTSDSTFKSEIPIVVNHHNNHIDFGTDYPHLCFKYILTKEGGGDAFTICQWFIFNISFSSSALETILSIPKAPFSTGTLELF